MSDLGFNLLVMVSKSAASAAAGKLGGTAAGLLLEMIGLGDNDMAELRKGLADIQTSLSAINAKLTALDAKLDWAAIDGPLGQAKRMIEDRWGEVATILTATSDRAQRDSLLRQKLLSWDATDLHDAMRSIHDAVMGQSGGINRSQPLPDMLLKTRWHWFHSPKVTMSVQAAYATYIDVFAFLGQLQRKAALLARNIELAQPSPNRPGADALIQELLANLRRQWDAFHKPLPMLWLFAVHRNFGSCGASFKAVRDLRTEGYYVRDGAGQFIRDSDVIFFGHDAVTQMTDTDTAGALTLEPTAPGATTYRIRRGFGPDLRLGKLTLITQPKVAPSSNPANPWQFDPGSDEVRTTFDAIMWPGQSNPDEPFAFEIMTMADPGHFALRMKDGRFLVNHNAGIANQVVTASKQAESWAAASWIIQLWSGASPLDRDYLYSGFQKV